MSKLRTAKNYRNGNGATTVTCDNPFTLWWLWGWHQHKEQEYNIFKGLFFFCKLNVIYWGIRFSFAVLMLGIVCYAWLHKTISSYTMNSSTLLVEAQWEITSWRKLQSARKLMIKVEPYWQHYWYWNLSYAAFKLFNYPSPSEHRY